MTRFLLSLVCIFTGITILPGIAPIGGPVSGESVIRCTATDCETTLAALHEQFAK